MSRQLDPDATREAILDASSRLFMQHGFDGVSLSKVAREADVTKSLIHHHFGSKKGLWEATKEQMFEPYERAQRAIIESDALEGQAALQQTIELFFSTLRDDERMRRMVSWMGLNDELSSMAMLQHISKEGVARIARAQERGLLRDDLEARHLLAMILAASHSYFTFAKCFADAGLVDEDREREQQLYLDAMSQVFLKGFAPAGDVEPGKESS